MLDESSLLSRRDSLTSPHQATTQNFPHEQVIPSNNTVF